MHQVEEENAKAQTVFLVEASANIIIVMASSALEEPRSHTMESIMKVRWITVSNFEFI